LPKVV